MGSRLRARCAGACGGCCLACGGRIGADAELQHAGDVAGENVGFEVDSIAGLKRAERGRGERLGNQRDLEPWLRVVFARNIRDGQRDTRERDRTLVYEVGSELGGEREAPWLSSDAYRFESSSAFSRLPPDSQQCIVSVG